MRKPPAPSSDCKLIDATNSTELTMPQLQKNSCNTQDAPSEMVINKSMKQITCSNAMITNPNPCNKTACSMPRDYL
jgi:hypothetical protein